MSHSGQNCRRYRVFVTNNTEYHIRDEVCLGVRRRGEHEWNREHPAVGQDFIGAIGARVTHSDEIPEPGARLLFGNSVLTSPVAEVLRPGPELADDYRERLAS